MHKKRKLESNSKGTKRTHAQNGSTRTHNRCHGSSNLGKNGAKHQQAQKYVYYSITTTRPLQGG